MLEDALKALSNYPIVEGAVALLILLAGYRIMSEGKKNGPTPGPSTAFTHEYPLWLMTGPAHDAFEAIDAIQNEAEQQTRLLTEMARESRRQTQLLENIWNENVINPRRLQE